MSVVPPEFAAGCRALLPGNGGDRRGISSPRLTGAFPPPPQEPCTVRLLSGCGKQGVLFLFTALSWAILSSFFHPVKVNGGKSGQKQVDIGDGQAGLEGQVDAVADAPLDFIQWGPHVSFYIA